jgi:hypothetical protein
MAEQDPAQPQQVTNAILKEGLNQQGAQLARLWDINQEQTVQLARLEDVPAKLDRLLSVNTNMATMQQQQLAHSQLIAANTADITKIGARLDTHISKTSARFSYYAGAAAVIVVVGGFFLWLAQETVQGAFSELSNIHTSIQGLSQEVALLQFQEGVKVQQSNPQKGAPK